MKPLGHARRYLPEADIYPPRIGTEKIGGTAILEIAEKVPAIAFGNINFEIGEQCGKLMALFETAAPYPDMGRVRWIQGVAQPGMHRCGDIGAEVAGTKDRTSEKVGVGVVPQIENEALIREHL